MGEPGSPDRGIRCAAHPEQPALARCDGCQLALCIDCTRSLGRLTACVHCGELAVPLTTDDEPSRDRGDPVRRGAAASGWTTSLRFPWRGRQRLLTAVIGLELAAMVTLERALGAGGCLFFLPRLLLFVLVVGLMADVTRLAGQGLEDLTEWPAYRPLGPRIREVLGAGVASLAGFAPAAALFSRLGCPSDLAAGGGLPTGCAAAMIGGLFAGAWLWLPAWVSVVRTNEISAALRVDEHWRLIRSRPRAALSTVSLCWLALLAGPALRSLLPSGSTAGAVTEVLFGAFGAVVAAHAAGTWSSTVDQEAGGEGAA